MNNEQRDSLLETRARWRSQIDNARDNNSYDDEMRVRGWAFGAASALTHLGEHKLARKFQALTVLDGLAASGGEHE